MSLWMSFIGIMDYYDDTGYKLERRQVSTNTSLSVLHECVKKVLIFLVNQMYLFLCGQQFDNLD